MEEFRITKEQINSIIEYLNLRNNLQAKKILFELKPNQIKSDVESLLRSMGRSNMIHVIEIQRILEKNDETNKTSDYTDSNSTGN